MNDCKCRECTMKRHPAGTGEKVKFFTGLINAMIMVSPLYIAIGVMIYG